MITPSFTTQVSIVPVFGSTAITGSFGRATSNPPSTLRYFSPGAMSAKDLSCAETETTDNTHVKTKSENMRFIMPRVYALLPAASNVSFTRGPQEGHSPVSRVPGVPGVSQGVRGTLN